MSIDEADFSHEISKGVLARFTTAAIGFVGSIIFARVLGPDGYGSFFIVVALANLLNRPIIGWAQACKKRYTEVDFPLDEALGAGLLGGILLSPVLIPAGLWLNRTVDLYDISGLVFPFVGFFVTISFYDITTDILSGQANFSSAQWADTLRSTLTTPLQLGLVLLLSMGTAGMVYGLTAATAAVVPYVLYKIRTRAAVPSMETVKSIGSFAKFSMITSTLGETRSRADILLLGALLTTAAAGQYQVAMQLTLPAQLLASVISVGLTGRISTHWSKGNEPAVVEDLSNSIAYAGILAIPIFFGALAMPSEILRLVFGAEYSNSGAMLVGLALFTVLRTQTYQLYPVVSGINRPEIGTKTTAVGLAVNLSLGVALLERMGAVGVVVATVIAEGVIYVVLAYSIKKQIPNAKLLSKPLSKQVLAAIVMFAIVWGLHVLLPFRSSPFTAALISVGAVSYGSVLMLISPEVRGTGYRVARSVFSR